MCMVEGNDIWTTLQLDLLRRVIQEAGGEPYLVGGVVRDLLLPGRPAPEDFDLIVTGLELSELAGSLRGLGEVAMTGAAFGVVRLTLDEVHIDLALPRIKELKTGTRHSDFSVVIDHNATVEQDLSRRDFTVNAMAMDGAGRVIDLFGGQQDLGGRLIRTVGDPNRRFTEDPLRMLRALQFAARLGFEIEAGTATAIRAHCHLLDSISGERILIELEKAWSRSAADQSLLVRLLDELGVGAALFGSEFRPLVPLLDGSPEELICMRFAAFFLHGGDSARVCPSRDMTDTLTIASKALAGELPLWRYIHRGDPLVPLALAVLAGSAVHEHRAAAVRLSQTLKLPLIASELPVTGGDLMAAGFHGPAIGVVQRRLLELIHLGSLAAEREALLAHIKMHMVDLTRQHES